LRKKKKLTADLYPEEVWKSNFRLIDRCNNSGEKIHTEKESGKREQEKKKINVCEKEEKSQHTVFFLYIYINVFRLPRVEK
jgi:hypothetical protein